MDEEKKLTREERVHIALTKPELKEWSEWASRRRMSVSEFVRQCVLEYIIKQDKEATR